jgi:hypothetical protein
MEDLPVFKKGDPASKLVDHKLINKAFGAINNLKRGTTGIPSAQLGGLTYRPEALPPIDAKLGRVMEVETSTGAFTAPTGKVNVIKFELVDALFAEVVGEQDITQQNGAGRIVYAAADPESSLSVNDYAWLVQWSGQWWVLNGSGGGGGLELKHGVVRSVCDASCGTYVVEIVKRSFSETCSGTTGTGTGSGVA